MKLLGVFLVCLTVSIHCQALRLRHVPHSANNHVETELFIAGGESAPEGFAPWQVSIQNQYGNHIGGGAIIADNYVLAAASILAGLDKRNVKVVTGTNNWMGSAWEYEVADIIVHCNFDKPLYHNDVALIKLENSIAYDEHTQSIDVAALDKLEEGEMLTMTGWGSKELGKPYPEELQKLQTYYISNERCREIFGEYAKDIDEGHLCAQPKSGGGACHGDTGGPLVNSNGQLVGIVNWGIPCGHGFPEVFARASFYNDWIRNKMNGCNLQNNLKKLIFFK